ncbi:hypothetical protein [Endozoicomonas sp. 2B-B]
MKILCSNIQAIALCICNLISSVCHSTPFIAEHRSGFTITGDISRYENSVLFNNVRMIRYASNESLEEYSHDYVYFKGLLEGRNDNRDIPNEEFFLFMDKFKDVSVIRKLLPLTFFVSEVTDKPVYITDIQSQNDITIAHGIVTTLSNENITLVFSEKSIHSTELDNKWTLRKIYLYKSLLNFDGLNNAREELSFTEVYTGSRCEFLIGNSREITYPSDIAVKLLFSASASVFSVAIIIVTPIVAVCIPFLLHSLKQRLEFR